MKISRLFFICAVHNEPMRLCFLMYTQILLLTRVVLPLIKVELQNIKDTMRGAISPSPWSATLSCFMGWSQRQWDRQKDQDMSTISIVKVIMWYQPRQLHIPHQQPCDMRRVSFSKCLCELLVNIKHSKPVNKGTCIHF